MDNTRTMLKEDVKAGRRFHIKDEHKSKSYSFNKLYGKRLAVRSGSHRHLGEVSDVLEDSFVLTTWFFNQEVSVLIPFSELLIIEPKN